MIDFSNCKPSGKIYEGSFWKKGIIYQGERYIIKSNKRNKKIFEANLQETYNSSIYSEYIACKVIKTMGIRVQSVLLGKYTENGRTRDVVACKDFLDKGEELYEFSKVKSSLIEDELIWQKIIKEQDSDIETLLKNLKLPQMNKKEFLEYYYNLFVIDAFIGNFDRHNGNWGYILTSEGKVKTSPIYDCGSSLFSLVSDAGMKILLDKNNIEKRMREKHFSAIKKNGKNINYYSYLENTEDKNMLLAIKKIVPMINIEEITKMIMKEKDISDIRKRFYCEVLKIKYETLLKPVYEKWFGKLKVKKVMSMYKYNVYTKIIVAITREKNEKFWDETKKEFDILIDKGKVKTDKETIYKIKWADEKRNEMIIVAYNIKSEKNAERLFEKTLNYGLEKKNLV